MGDVELQKPVEVVSQEIEVISPIPHDFGPLQLGFKGSLTPELQAAGMTKRLNAACSSGPRANIDCTVFHYAIRNLGARPVRNGGYTCSDLSIIPAYRTKQGEWKQLQPRLQACTANIFFEEPILPGHAVEGDFTLSTLAPLFDTSPLSSAGRYEIHFTFSSNACFASPDAGFCIQAARKQTEVISNVLTINPTAYTAVTPQTK